MYNPVTLRYFFWENMGDMSGRLLGCCGYDFGSFLGHAWRVSGGILGGVSDSFGVVFTGVRTQQRSTHSYINLYKSKCLVWSGL